VSYQRIWQTLTLLALIAASHGSRAQLQVLSSAPADGTTGLPGLVELCLTFSANLDTTLHWPVNGDEFMQLPVAMIIAEPRDNLFIFDSQWDGATRRLCIDLQLEPETDFIFLISQAGDVNGNELDEPLELHLSTAAGWSPRTVAGTVDREDGGPATGAAMALFHNFPFGIDETSLVAGTVVREEGAYTIPHVRAGWYFPVAALDLNQDGLLEPDDGDLFGYYDGNGDQQPDSIYVGGADLTGVDISLRVFAPLLARDGLSTASATAVQELAPDAQLEAVYSTGETVNNQGRSFGWAYQFHSGQTRLYLVVIVNAFGVEFVPIDSSLVMPMAALDPGFLDSDVALTIALAAGGAAFEEALVERYRFTGVGNLHWTWQGDPQAFLWVVNFMGIDQEGQWQDFRVLLDALSGEVYSAESGLHDDTRAMPSAFTLGPPWPNPFNPAVHIPYELARAGELRMVVYNLAGQLMAEPVHGPQAAGRHEALLRAEGWPSGLYLVTLEMAGHRETRKIALLR